MLRPEPDSSSGVIEIDPDGMAEAADRLGKGAHEISGGRDSINAAWELKASAFGSDYVGAIFDQCCETWVNGLDSIGQLVDDAATYTQQLANLFGATDTTVAEHMTRMYTKADLQPPPSGSNPPAAQDPNLA